MKLSVIIPAYNEERTIYNTIQKTCAVLSEYDMDYNIVVVNDGSTDKTYETALEAGIDNGYVINCARNKGKGNCFRVGINNSVGDLVLLMDADMQVSPRQLPVFLNLMDLYCADVVIGSKLHDYSYYRYSFFRKVISWGYRIMVKTLFGLRLRDTQCGFKLFKREAVERILPLLSIDEFAFDIELLVALQDNGYSIVEAPVKMAKPVKTSSVKVNKIVKVAKDTMRVWVKRLSGQYLLR